MEQIWIHEMNSNVVNIEDCTGHNRVGGSGHC